MGDSCKEGVFIHSFIHSRWEAKGWSKEKGERVHFMIINYGVNLGFITFLCIIFQKFRKCFKDRQC